MKNVWIIQRILANYRVPFFNELREVLKTHDIALNLIYGHGNSQDESRAYMADLPWALQIRERYLNFGNEHLVFQPYLSYLRKADLIIILQEMKLLLNYLLLIGRNWQNFKVAYWGHSINFRDERNSLKNQLKRKLNNAADWWFAYTDGEAKLLQSGGFPISKITVTHNSIDTNHLLRLKCNIQKKEIDDIRAKLGIKPGQPVGIYCGGMYKEKRLDFLFATCVNIRKKIPDFHIILVGGGPEEKFVAAMCKENSWIHFVGPVFEREQVLYFMISDLLLMPGLVGLVILDSFALEVPLVTTQYACHSPEIEYLEDGHNGIVTKNNEQDYSESVIRILSDPILRQSLKNGCSKSVVKYSTKQMIKCFSEGITKCLAS